MTELEHDSELTVELTHKKAFLADLSSYGNVSRAAEKSGVSRQYWYRMRSEDAAFSESWDKALEIGTEALEDEAKRRAYEGWDEPVFYEGVECGTKRKFSDTLLIVLLKAHKPDKYRENINVTGEMSISNLEKARERAKERL